MFKISFRYKRILNTNFLDDFIDINSITQLSASQLYAKALAYPEGWRITECRLYLI